MDCDNFFIPYCNRDEWKDITPTSIVNATGSICQINYSEKFKDVMGYYCSILESGEESERVFQLVTDAILLNVANYSLWSHRRMLLLSLGKDLKEEMKFTEKLMVENPKVYQLWYHRIELLKILNDFSEEMKLCGLILLNDPKNYHAWQHRYWVLDYFNLWLVQDEKTYLDYLLDLDPYNNSVWNHRYQVFLHKNAFEDSETVKSEYEFVFSIIFEHLDNESVWNYLNGILKYLTENLIKDCIEKVKKIIIECDSKEKSEKCKLAYDFIAHYYFENIDNISEAEFSMLCTYCSVLTDVDDVRSGYWNYLLNQAKKEFSGNNKS